MLELAEFADQNKFFGVFLNDHIQSFSRKGKDPILEAWTAMTGIGVGTKKVRIGQIVLFNSLRNPAFLAKSIATLDNMIQGRYECMIGSGWNAVEYESYDLMEQGRGMPSAKERVNRFEESLIILKGMLNNQTFSYEGKYWKIDNAMNIPQPVQKNMRISVGAKKPRMLKITAKHADGLNIASGLEDMERIINEIRPEIVNNGKNDKEYFFTGFHSIYLAENENSYESMLKDLSKSSNKPIDYIKKYNLIGTPDIIKDKLRTLKDLGIRMTIIILRTGVKPLEQDELIEKYSYFTDNIMKNL